MTMTSTRPSRALWTELEWALSDDVRILAGLRGESHDYDYTTKAPPGINGRFNVPADRSDSYEFLTPKLGAVWSVSDTVDLYANYARGARAPQVSDLYRLQSLQVVGQIDTETLDSVELGARGAAMDGRLVFDVAAYWMDKENYFFRDSNGLNVHRRLDRAQGCRSLRRLRPHRHAVAVG
jgi:iron complex outermembrane receptor protein